MSADAFISGLGMTELSREASDSTGVLAAQAVMSSISDAGLKRSDIDGLVITRSGAASEKDLGLFLQRSLGMRNLAFLQVLHGEGTSAIQAVQTAVLAVSAGLARHIVCVFADAPVVPGLPSHKSFGRVKTSRGVDGLRYSAGLFGGAAVYATAARRHMALYGTKEEHFGAMAISTREWASLNPQALQRAPLTMTKYMASRFIAEPFRLYDCALPVNGGVAVVVSAPKYAGSLGQPAVYVHGFGQGHPCLPDSQGFEPRVNSGAVQAGKTAFSMAGITAKDIDICELYDAFSYIPMLALEDYGFCKKGEAGPFVASGATSPGNALPVNTGGGHLSGGYLQGMTPIGEAVIQARGQAGARQCPKHDLVLVSNEGGCFDHHACLVLSPHRR